MKLPANCPPPGMLLAAGEGVLPPEAEAEVRAHLESCATCAQLRDDLSSAALAEPTLENLENVRQRVLGRRRAFPRYAGVAAAAAAVLLAVYFWSPARGPHPTVQPGHEVVHYRLALEPAPLRLPLATALVLRGKPASGSPEYLTALGEALQPYRAGQYSESTQRLAALAAKYPKAVEPPFYQGVAMLMAGDAAGARGPLDRAHQIDGEALTRDIAWYRAIAAERTGDWKSAAPLLESLCGKAGEYAVAACTALGRQ